MFGFAMLAVGEFCCKLDVLFVECLTTFPKVGFRYSRSLSAREIVV